MKYLFLFISALVFTNCSQQGYPVSSDQKDDKEVYADNFSGTVEDQLAMVLRKTSGVQVQQIGNSYIIRVRGVSSMNTQVRPLYIIDGISMGNDFTSAASAIAGNKIKSVRVLKGQDASFYGTRGAGGVIVIKTEKPELSS